MNLKSIKLIMIQLNKKLVCSCLYLNFRFKLQALTYGQITYLLYYVVIFSSSKIRRVEISLAVKFRTRARSVKTLLGKWVFIRVSKCVMLHLNNTKFNPRKMLGSWNFVKIISFWFCVVDKTQLENLEFIRNLGF